MKLSKLLLNALLIATIIVSQANAQKADPSVNGATVIPAPNTYPGGSGSVSFSFANSSGFSIPINSGNHINVTLSKLGVTNAFNPANITGPGAVFFTWTYDAALLTLTGTQSAIIPAGGGGAINFLGLTVTGASAMALPQNGLNVNVVFLSAFNQSTSNDNTFSFTYSAPGGPVPVTLLSFNSSVKNCGVNLKWSTTQELDLKDFTVQTSPKGSSNWTTIATVSAKGNSSSKVDYTFTHANPVSGENYYRMIMTDKNGTVRFSDIISANVSCARVTPIRITPNPFIDRIGIHFTSQDNEVVTVQLLDNTGKQIQSRQVSATLGDNVFDLTNLGILPRGLYMVQVKTSTDVFTEKLVK